MEISDIWRLQHPGEIGTTWTNATNIIKKKRVRPRTDRILVDNRILDRITETDITKTKVSDHDAVRWTITTEISKKRSAYNELPIEIIQDKQYQEIVKNYSTREKQ